MQENCIGWIFLELLILFLWTNYEISFYVLGIISFYKHRKNYIGQGC